MPQNDLRRTKHHSPDSQLYQLSFSAIYPNVATLEVISNLTFTADSTIFGVIEKFMPINQERTLYECNRPLQS